MGHVWLNENVVLKTCTRCGYTEGSIGGGTLRPTETDVGSSNVSVASTTSTLFDTVTEHHEYTYASGKLLREVVTTTTTTADGETETTTDTLDFFYDASGTPFAVEYNGTLYYYITNLQGDVMQLVNASGTAVAAYEYDPYGNIVSTTGDLAETNPLRYRGYVYDTESDLYYCQSRYYDPAIGRFINADTLVSTGQGLLGNNMFAYCGNNPINFRDSEGTAAIPIVVAEAALSGLIPAIACLVTGGSIEDAALAFLYGVASYGFSFAGKWADLITIITSAFNVFQNAYKDGLNFWDTLKVLALDIAVNLINIDLPTAGSDVADLFVDSIVDTGLTLCTTGVQTALYNCVLESNEVTIVQFTVPIFRVAKATNYSGSSGGKYAFAKLEVNYGHIY